MKQHHSVAASRVAKDVEELLQKSKNMMHPPLRVRIQYAQRDALETRSATSGSGRSNTLTSSSSSSSSTATPVTVAHEDRGERRHSNRGCSNGKGMKEKNVKNAKIGKHSRKRQYWRRPRPIPSDSNTPIYFDKDVVRNADNVQRFGNAKKYGRKICMLHEDAFPAHKFSSCPLLNEAKRFMKEYGYISPASRKRVVEGLRLFQSANPLFPTAIVPKLRDFILLSARIKMLEAGPRHETEMVVGSDREGEEEEYILSEDDDLFFMDAKNRKHGPVTVSEFASLQSLSLLWMDMHAQQQITISAAEFQGLSEGDGTHFPGRWADVKDHFASLQGKTRDVILSSLVIGKGGMIDVGEILRFCRRNFSSETPVWMEGMKSWRTVAQLPQLARFLNIKAEKDELRDLCALISSSSYCYLHGQAEAGRASHSSNQCKSVKEARRQMARSPYFDAETQEALVQKIISSSGKQLLTSVSERRLKRFLEICSQKGIETKRMYLSDDDSVLPPLEELIEEVMEMMSAEFRVEPRLGWQVLRGKSCHILLHPYVLANLFCCFCRRIAC